MEQVLLGLAAPAAARTAGSLLERTLTSVVVPFTTVLEAIAEAFSSDTNEAASLGALDLQADLANRIESVLATAGVDLSQPITLRISAADGQLEVVDDHPQKALIEAALAGEPDLARKFTEFAALPQTGITALFVKSDEGAKLELRTGPFTQKGHSERSPAT